MDMRWRSVHDASTMLAPTGKPVLLLERGGGAYVGTLRKDIYGVLHPDDPSGRSRMGAMITHWMPLPEMPEQGNPRLCMIMGLIDEMETCATLPLGDDVTRATKHWLRKLRGIVDAS